MRGAALRGTRLPGRVVSPGNYFSARRVSSTTSTQSLLAQDLSSGPVSATVEGWVRSVRQHKKWSFVSVNQGDSTHSIQITAPTEMIKDLVQQGLSNGSTLRVRGNLTRVSPEKPVELAVSATDGKLELLGACDGATYPLQKKAHSPEFLREITHLRARSDGFAATLRVRSRVASTLRRTLEQTHDYSWVSTPILTANDCEGAGELFHVTSPKLDRFFGKDQVYLTVSGQLHAEMFALGLKKVYTFGPTFRAEDSNTTRHLAEFWMLEPEACFINAREAAELAEECIEASARACQSSELSPEIDYLAQLHRQQASEASANTRTSLDLHARIERASDRSKFAHLTYAEAVRAIEKGADVAAPRPRGSLSSHHERFLVEKHCGGFPVVVRDYPLECKPFYCLSNDDEANTGANFDILVPGVCEVVGGSAREHRHDVLEARMTRMNLLPAMQWYLDLRKYGSAPHAGFGIGFDRLVQFLTGEGNIRDVVPAHRARQELQF